MSKIVAIDYGQKRVGVAASDTINHIAFGLTTVQTKDIITFLKDYCSQEDVRCIIVGEPKTLNNMPSEAEKLISPFIKQLKTQLPQIEIKRWDERFTSKMAFQTMIDGGLKQKSRRNKNLVDEISATIILQSYLENINKTINS